MMNKIRLVCPECKKSEVEHDEIHGEYFCRRCGLVMEEMDNIKHVDKVAEEIKEHDYEMKTYFKFKRMQNQAEKEAQQNQSDQENLKE